MTIYYVATTGNDSTGTGAIGNPWLTLQKAANVIAGGDTVLVNDGTYSITSAVTITTGGASEATRTVFKSLNVLGAKLVNNITVANNDSLDAIFYVAADFVDIVGFDASGANGRLFVRGYGHNGSGHGSPIGSHIRVMQCYVHDLGQNVSTAYNVYGMLMGQYSNGASYLGGYNEVSRCFLRNIGYTGSVGAGNQGIYLTTLNDICVNTIVEGVAGYGIKCYHFANHETIANNLIISCGTVGNSSTGGICIAAGGGGWVQGTDEPCDFCVVSNNIFRDCRGSAAIHEDAGGFTPVSQIVANNTFSNNSYFGNLGSLSNTAQLDSGASDSNHILTDQLFYNYQADGTGDYRLTSSSPCIDAGTSLGAPTIDYDGNGRPQKQGFDIGPFEIPSVVLFPATKRRTGIFPATSRRTGLFPATSRRQS